MIPFETSEPFARPSPSGARAGQRAERQPKDGLNFEATLQQESAPRPSPPETQAEGAGGSPRARSDAARGREDDEASTAAGLRLARESGAEDALGAAVAPTTPGPRAEAPEPDVAGWKGATASRRVPDAHLASVPERQAAASDAAQAEQAKTVRADLAAPSAGRKL